MLYTHKKFNAKEQNAYLQALMYILNLSGPDNDIKRGYLQLQMKEAGIDENKCEDGQPRCTRETLIKQLKSLENIRTQRYIIREMIMLAIADHEITDEEIRNIYQIAEAIGVSGEKVGDFFIWAAKGIEWKLEGIQLVEEDL